MKTFKSSHLSSYFWVMLVKKEPYICPIAFNHFAGHLRELCYIVCCSEFYLFSECFLKLYIYIYIYILEMGLGHFLGWVLVIKYVFKYTLFLDFDLVKT